MDFFYSRVGTSASAKYVSTGSISTGGADSIAFLLWPIFNLASISFDAIYVMMKKIVYFFAMIISILFLFFLRLAKKSARNIFSKN